MRTLLGLILGLTLLTATVGAQTITFHAVEGCGGDAVSVGYVGHPFSTYFKLYSDCAVTLSGCGISNEFDGNYSGVAHCIGSSTPTSTGTVTFSACGGEYVAYLTILGETPTPTETPTITPTPTSTPTQTPTFTQTPTNTGTPTNTPTATRTHTPTPGPTWTPLPGAADVYISAYRKWGVGQKLILSNEIGLVPGSWITLGEVEGSRSQIGFTLATETVLAASPTGSQYLFVGLVEMAQGLGPVTSASGSLSTGTVNYDITGTNVGADLELHIYKDAVQLVTAALNLSSVADDLSVRTEYIRGAHAFIQEQVFSVRLYNVGVASATVENVAVVMEFYLDS